MFWDIALPLMKKKGISQYQLSTELGKDKSQVGKWISRGTIPPGDSLLLMAKILGVRVESFFPDLFPNAVSMSDTRRKFHNWVDDMTEEDMIAIQKLFKVLGAYGVKLDE